jgi:hypothetical protein
MIAMNASDTLPLRHRHPKLVEAAASHGFAGVAAVAFCTALSPVLAHAPRGTEGGQVLSFASGTAGNGCMAA